MLPLLDLLAKFNFYPPRVALLIAGKHICNITFWASQIKLLLLLSARARARKIVAIARMLGFLLKFALFLKIT